MGKPAAREIRSGDGAGGIYRSHGDTSFHWAVGIRLCFEYGHVRSRRVAGAIYSYDSLINTSQVVSVAWCFLGNIGLLFVVLYTQRTRVIAASKFRYFNL